MTARVFDVLVVGSGAAGLTAAINLAPTLKVGVIAKGKLNEGATGWAQGGIAAVLEEGDSFEAHVRDTMIAGAGLNNLAIVEHVVGEAPAAIARLTELGVPFATENGGLHLTREGGHSHRRIVHVADATGWAVQQALERAASAHPNITLIPDMVAIDLITGRHAADFTTSGAVHGLYAFNRGTGRVDSLLARATVLATGGAGRTYLYSTAPRGATGDGIAMAWRAGCRISNMEFMQFHPTCLYNLEVKNFLITEAVRGEGGLLKHPTTGHRFMPDYDERGELAPRDVVARAIDHEIKRDGLDYVHLDISHRDPEFVKEHFPNIYEKLLDARDRHHQATDPGRSRPALHLRRRGRGHRRPDRRARPLCRGRSDPVGPARRQPSRLQFIARMPRVRRRRCQAHPRPLGRSSSNRRAIRAWDESRVTDSDEEVVIQQCWGEIRRFMWNFVGIVRTTKRLERAKHRIDLLRQEVDDYYKHFRVTPDLIELRNLLEVADLIVRSALSRHESRGLHYTLDYPEMAAEAVDTVLVP